MDRTRANHRETSISRVFVTRSRRRRTTNEATLLGPCRGVGDIVTPLNNIFIILCNRGPRRTGAEGRSGGALVHYNALHVPPRARPQVPPALGVPQPQDHLRTSHARVEFCDVTQDVLQLASEVWQLRGFVLLGYGQTERRQSEERLCQGLTQRDPASVRVHSRSQDCQYLSSVSGGPPCVISGSPVWTG